MKDEYAIAQEAQNAGGICRHCRSRSGHVGSCKLITGEFFLHYETPQSENWPTFSEADKAYAKSFGISL